eukprot:3715026-Rhodomonas_salina.2
MPAHDNFVLTPPYLRVASLHHRASRITLPQTPPRPAACGRGEEERRLACLGARAGGAGNEVVALERVAKQEREDSRQDQEAHRHQHQRKVPVLVRQFPAAPPRRRRRERERRREKEERERARERETTRQLSPDTSRSSLSLSLSLSLSAARCVTAGFSLSVKEQEMGSLHARAGSCKQREIACGMEHESQARTGTGRCPARGGGGSERERRSTTLTRRGS